MIQYFFDWNIFVFSYLKDKRYLFYFFLAGFFVFTLSLCSALFKNTLISIFINDIITSLLVYNFMIFIASCYRQKTQSSDNRKISFKILYKKHYLKIILFIKILWNIFNSIIMGYDYSPCEDSSLISAFLLFLSWGIIYLISAFYLPYETFKDHKKKIDIKIFFDYVINNFLIIVTFTLISLIYSFFFIIGLAFFLQNIYYIFYLFSSYNTIHKIKYLCETIIYCYTIIFYSYLITISFLHIYKKNSYQSYS